VKQQHETDLSDPRQRFVWAFRGIDFNGTPMSIPEAVLESWSEHLSQCGFVHDSSQQTIHYQPPVRGQDHPMNLSGQWVPMSQPLKQPLVPNAQRMTAAEKAKMIQEFKEEGLID
jgi:Protein of unknown function (DUF2744).